mmetsp:Transcript_645/g.1690  ORF Transcript_645/g.1690 Transcript_645/m.1690 type:complete len:146 (+) Transcript_645:488-925(+)
MEMLDEMFLWEGLFASTSNCGFSTHINELLSGTPVSNEQDAGTASCASGHNFRAETQRSRAGKRRSAVRTRVVKRKEARSARTVRNAVIRAATSTSDNISQCCLSDSLQRGIVDDSSQKRRFKKTLKSSGSEVSSIATLDKILQE